MVGSYNSYPFLDHRCHFCTDRTCNIKIEVSTILIAIDGDSASGKGTVGKRVADTLGIAFLDTGKLYRFVGYTLLNKGIDLNDARIYAPDIAKDIVADDINSATLSSEKVGHAASVVSAIPDVRANLLDFQRKIAAQGAVLDGRDIGTVVCPNADFKFFITATLEIRAERRFNELQKVDSTVIYADVLRDLQNRDERDTQRDISPSCIAKDGILIDTTYMNVDDVFLKIMSIIESSAL